MINLNESNFKEIISKTPRLVVDVWQEGCEPCSKFAPIFMFAEKLIPGLKFANYKVDRNASSEFKREYLKFEKGENASSPTTILFEDGKMVRRIAGYIGIFWLSEFILSGMPKKLEDYSKEQLESLAYRNMRSGELYHAVAEDTNGFVSLLNQEIMKRD